MQNTNNLKENIKNNIPKSLNFKDILGFFKKLFWLVIIIFIAFNIILLYFLNGIIYFLVIIIGNIVLFWALIPVLMWVGKTFIIEKAVEVGEEVKENTVNYSKEKIVKVVNKKK